MLFDRRQDPPAAHAIDEGGGYLASAADLIIGLLFIFIIMVVVLALQQRKQTDAVMNAGDPLVEVTSALGEALKRINENVTFNPRTGVITLPEDVLFRRGQSNLMSGGIEMLTMSAEVLAEAMGCFVHSQRQQDHCAINPMGHEIETIFIEGHTDSVPFNGAGRDNFTLSLARARSVNEVLRKNEDLNDFRNRDDQPLFSYSAYADTRPLPDTDPADGTNRRVDLRVVLSYRAPAELLRGALRPGSGTR